MNFTKDVPTVPGDYKWRESHAWDGMAMTLVWDEDDQDTLVRVGDWEALPLPNGGEWCRLVPADVVTGLSEAIEGLCKHVPAAEDHAQFTPLQKEVSQALKALARAKRVMEGRE